MCYLLFNGCSVLIYCLIGVNRLFGLPISYIHKFDVKLEIAEREYLACTGSAVCRLIGYYDLHRGAYVHFLKSYGPARNDRVYLCLEQGVGGKIARIKRFVIV